MEAAVAALGPAADVEIVWRPFELNPGLPPEGTDRKVYRTAKFGSLERSRELEARVQEAARPDGLVFAFERILRTPNTADAHRLLARARTAGIQEAAAEALFRGYFQEGLDVGDRRTLAALASTLGLDPAFLDSGEGLEELRREEQEGLALGIRGVPFLVLDGRTAFPGAPSTAELLRAFRNP